ncbi:MAG: hypothetical protein ABIO32_15390 [Ferruginibacter sp.]
MKLTIIKALFLLPILLWSCSQPGATRLQNSSAPTDAPQPLIFSEGLISTSDYETHPAFSPTGDTIYFLKGTPNVKYFTICVSYKQDTGWTAPVIATFSGKYLDADPFVTKDGNTIYFVSNRPANVGDSIRKDWDIWKVERSGTGWSNPVHLDSNFNTNENEYFPTLAANGNFYFGSERPGGKGNSDMYVSKYKSGKYAAPENLGDSINTPDNEYEPFIAPDESYLIFMGTYPATISNSDFCISYNVNGKWTKAIKLPAPINSPATEWGGKVSPGGKYFFFGSNRSTVKDVLPKNESIDQFQERLHSVGNGLGDIYYVNLSALKPIK